MDNRKISTNDVTEIIRILSVTQNNGESFDKDTHLNKLIEKPWGFEYRVYCDSLFDVWKLHIQPKKSTSMHCHIQKDTILICLAGSGFTKFLDNAKQQLSPGESVYINKGVFHQTFSSDNETLQLIEVENPRNKFDLLRLKDSYGREKMAYESNSIDHDMLSPFVNISMGAHIRAYDLYNEFSFVVEPLTEAHLSSSQQLWIVAIDVNQHLSGLIKIVNKDDPESIRYLNKRTLLILKNNSHTFI